MIKSRSRRKGKSVAFAALFTFLLLFSGRETAWAAEIPQPTEEFYVNDFAGVLSDETKAYIIEKNDALCAATGAQIVVVTLSSLEGEDTEDFADKLFREYGIGSREEDNGVLLLLSVEDRMSRIEVGYGLEGILNDGKTGRIQNENMIPAFAEEKWDEGIRSGFDAILSEVEKELAGDDAGNAAVEEAVSWYRDPNTMLALFFGLTAVAAVLCAKLHKRRLGISLTLGWIAAAVILSGLLFGGGYALVSLLGNAVFGLIGRILGEPGFFSGSGRRRKASGPPGGPPGGKRNRPGGTRSGGSRSGDSHTGGRSGRGGSAGGSGSTRSF